MSDPFTALVSDYVEWASSTFGLEGSPVTRAELLRREVKELLDDPTDPDEMADVLLTLIWLADTQGVDLVNQAWAKLAVLKRRKWGHPDGHHIAHHIPGGDAS